MKAAEARNEEVRPDFMQYHSSPAVNCLIILIRARELKIKAIPEAMLNKAELVTTVTASPEV